MAPVDMNRVRAVLKEATREGGPFSQRGLSREAGLSRDIVYDIIVGRNKNPTIDVLAKLASAMKRELSDLGVTSTAPSQDSLREAFEGVLEGIPEYRQMPEAELAQLLAEHFPDVLAGARGSSSAKRPAHRSNQGRARSQSKASHA